MGYMSILSRLSSRERVPRDHHRPLILNHGILILLVAFAILPLVVLLFNSVKSNAEIGLNPLGIPRAIQFDNFANAWEQGEFATTAGNSVILVVATVTSVLILAGMASYGLARRKPPGSDIFMFYMLVAS